MADKEFDTKIEKAFGDGRDASLMQTAGEIVS